MPFTCFAYGSNMFTAKMRRAAPSAQPRAIASLPGHVLRFDKHSQDDGSGKGNILATAKPEDVVWGVLFDIADQDRSDLDRSEGGYTRIATEVLTAEGPLPAVTYIARPDRVDDTLKPYTWYKDFVVRGAQQHGLPDGYIEQLTAIEAVGDPDAARDRHNRCILRMP